MSSLAERLKQTGVIDSVLSQDIRLREQEAARGDPFTEPLALAMHRQAEERLVRRMSPAERAEVDHHRIRQAGYKAAAAAEQAKPKLTRAEKQAKVEEWLATLAPEQLDAVEDKALANGYGEHQSDMILSAIDNLKAAANYSGAAATWDAEDDEAAYRAEQADDYYFDADEQAAALLAGLPEGGVEWRGEPWEEE